MEYVAHMPGWAFEGDDDLQSGLRFGEIDAMVELVAYTVVWREPGEVFVGQRIAGASEDRLSGMKFLGWGGNVSRRDRLLDGYNGPLIVDKTIGQGAVREVFEELDGVDRKGFEWPEYLGALYHPIDEVSSDHVGAVFSLEVPRDSAVSVREDHKYAGDWRTAESVAKENHQGYENWSRLLMPHLEDIVGGLS